MKRDGYGTIHPPNPATGRGWALCFWVRGQGEHRPSVSTVLRQMGEPKPARAAITEADAERALKWCIERRARGEVVAPQQARLTVREVLQDYLAGRAREPKRDPRNQRDLGYKVTGLIAEFGHRRVATLTRPGMLEWYDAGIDDGYQPGTLMNYLGVVHAACTYAKEHTGTLATVPDFMPRMNVQNAREGYFTDEEFAAFAQHLSPVLRRLFTVAAWTGWRVADELFTRQRRHVDLVSDATGWLRLEPSESKNKKGREFPLSFPVLRVAIEAQLAETAEWERDTGRITPWLFHRDGEPIRDTSRAWAAACAAAGLTDKQPHDLRRTAINRLENEWLLSRKMVMDLVGHTSEAIHRRYNIVDRRQIVSAVDHAKMLRGTTARAVDPDRTRTVIPFLRSEG